MDLLMFIVAVVVVLAMVGYFIYRRLKPDAVSVVTPEIEAIRKRYDDMVNPKPPAKP